MCPSYMVTLEEEHSTRGRANLLRLAFSGVHPARGADRRPHPRGPRPLRRVQGVQGRVPLRRRHGQAQVRGAGPAQQGARRAPARAGVREHQPAQQADVAGGPLANIVGAICAGASGAVDRFVGIRAAAAAAGVRLADLPRPGSRSDPSAKALEARARGEVVLFHDTFTDYYHPEVGKAAVRVLEALGYRVVRRRSRRPAAGGRRSRRACCRRRRRWARAERRCAAALRRARRADRRHRALVPADLPATSTRTSCATRPREDGGSARLLLDEFIVDAGEARGRTPCKAVFKDDLQRDVLLHAHCHQKAASAPTRRWTRCAWCPATRATLIDTSCCGMAGSFGFEAEHYDVSKAMGGLRLFPAVEAVGEDTAIAITACHAASKSATSPTANRATPSRSWPMR